MTPLPFRPLRLVVPLVLTALVACGPSVKVEAPDKPIVINLNVKIEHEVRVKVEKDVEDLFKKNSNLF